MVKLFEVENQRVARVLDAYRNAGVSATDLGVRVSIPMDCFQEAVEELGRLNGQQSADIKSPIEKRDCIKRTIDLISTAFSKEQQQESPSSGMSLSLSRVAGWRVVLFIFSLPPTVPIVSPRFTRRACKRSVVSNGR